MLCSVDLRRNGAHGSECAFIDPSVPGCFPGEHSALCDCVCAGAWGVAVFYLHGESGRRTVEGGVNPEIAGAKPGAAGLQSVRSNRNHYLFDVDKHGTGRGDFGKHWAANSEHEGLSAGWEAEAGAAGNRGGNLYRGSGSGAWVSES